MEEIPATFVLSQLSQHLKHPINSWKIKPRPTYFQL